MKSEPRIAFITDALPSVGGAEKTLFTTLEIFPNADVFTLIYNREVFVNTPLAKRTIRTSFLNLLSLAQKHHRTFLPLMPLAIERFNLRDYDLIVSFNYAVANGIRRLNGARHISYTYTPMRYAWRDLNINGTRSRNQLPINWLMRNFRKWDKKAASRVDEFAAISHVISERVQCAYQREARVIYPPVEIERFHPSAKRSNYYVTVSRLVAHKRLDLIVKAFSCLQLPLLVIGNGPELPRLMRMAAANIKFMGYQPDDKVAELLSKARGFVCAAEEDFGIAIVEAQAAGCRVIAYGSGGALETVTAQTGIFFEEQTTDCLIEAAERYERAPKPFNTEDLVSNAGRFSKERFQREFTAFLKGV